LFIKWPKIRRILFRHHLIRLIQEVKKPKRRKKDYLACFEDWKKRWLKCILSRGDEIDLDEYIKLFHFTNKILLAFCPQ